MPGENWPIELRARRSPEQRCAFCHGGIGVSAMACLRCQTLFHEDCASEYGKCPTLGCTGRGPRPAEQPAQPFLDEPIATYRHALSWVWLWVRLVVGTALFTTIGLPAFLVGLGLVFTATPWALLSPLPFAIAYLALYAINRERHFLNGVRTAFARRPVVLRVYSTRDGDGPRVDLRAEGAEPTEAAAMSLRFGSFGPPGWLSAASRVRVHGLSDFDSPAVIESAEGHRHFASAATIRRSIQAWRRGNAAN